MQKDYIYMNSIKNTYGHKNYLDKIYLTQDEFKDILRDHDGSQMVFESFMRGLDDKYRSVVREFIKIKFSGWSLTDTKLSSEAKKHIGSKWLNRVEKMYGEMRELIRHRENLINKFRPLDFMHKDLAWRYDDFKRKVYRQILGDNLNANERSSYAGGIVNIDGEWCFSLDGHGKTFRSKPIIKDWLRKVGNEGIATAEHGSSRVLVLTAKYLNQPEENITVFRATWLRKIGSGNDRTWIEETGFVGRFGTAEQAFAVKTSARESFVASVTRRKAMHNILENVADRQAS